MTINERVIEVRRRLGLSQAALAERLNISQSAVNWLEKDGNGVSDRNIRQMSREFGVNEQWLRAGEGEMFLDDTDRLLEPLKSRFNLSAEEVRGLAEYLTAAPNERRKVLEAIKTLSGWLNK